jgi:hypothetical protein
MQFSGLNKHITNPVFITFKSTSPYPAFGSSITDMQYARDTAVKYRYGFNGQEKDDEVSGEGDFNAAEFWEYDCRLGRRWNLDPVVKPYLSSYSTFSNCPIALIDPYGDDFYLNSKTGERKTEMGEGTDVRLISDEDYTKAKKEFIADAKAQFIKDNPNATAEQISDFELLRAPGLFGSKGKSYLDKYSKLVTFESLETQTQFISEMEKKTEAINSAGQDDNANDVEQGGYVVLDLVNAKAKLIHTSSGTAGVNKGIVTMPQTYYRTDNPNIKFVDKEMTLLVLADWHTHPQYPGSEFSRGPSLPSNTVGTSGQSDTEVAKFNSMTGFVFDYYIYTVEKSGIVQSQYRVKGKFDVIKSAWKLYYTR